MKVKIIKIVKIKIIKVKQNKKSQLKYSTTKCFTLKTGGKTWRTGLGIENSNYEENNRKWIETPRKLSQYD